jgi:hypothetical protein
LTLIEETDWDRYGTGNNPKCANYMAHCGYETTAVNDTIKHPLGPYVFLRVRTDGALAPGCRSVFSRWIGKRQWLTHTKASDSSGRKA